jgi:predicted small metal-binding protein
MEGGMKAFACGDVVPGCQARWVCTSDDEILFEVAQHARADHGIKEIPGELVTSVRAAIVEVA